MTQDDQKAIRVGVPRVTIKQVAAELKELEQEVDEKFGRVDGRIKRLETLIEKKLDRLDQRLWGIAVLIIAAAVANNFWDF
tara:strand:+ start:963 stop:1205 length:243 start_codon:yes stop_codon:yes gene_type:complete